MDFFATEVLTLKGLTTYYVLFFIHLETRQVKLAGFTPYPDQEWMEQQGRNITMEEWGCLKGCRYLLHDRRCEVLPIISGTDQDGKCESSLASKKPESELVRGTLGKVGQRGMSVEADPVWRMVAAAGVAAIYGTLPRGAQPSGQRQSDFVSFAGGKGEHGRCAVSRTAGRPAEVLRERSGIRIDGTAFDGHTISTYIKDARLSLAKDLSGRIHH